MKKTIFWFTALTILLLDQISKYVVTQYFSYTTNTGVAFGFFKGANWFFMILNVLIVVFMFYYFKNNLFSAIIIGGALGNLADRLIRGFVIDFINIGFWPSFNIADSAITIGGILLAIKLFKKENS